MVAALAAVTVAGGLTACQGSALPNPSAELDNGQAMLDLAQITTTLREENAMMQAQLDSLRDVVAYQDSIVRQLAAVSGVSMRPQTASSPQ